MENGKSKKAQRNTNNSEISNDNGTPFSSPVVSPRLSEEEIKQSNNNVINKVIQKVTHKVPDKVPIENNENSYNERQKEQNQEKEQKEPTLEKLILNLKIISKLRPGYKLSLNTEDNESNVYIDNSYLQYFYRLFSDNSRQTTITFLENLDNNISKKIENLLSQDNSDMFLNSKENILLNLSHDLNLSLIGLNNLINTYAGDECSISKIEMIINNFELKIRKITNILKVN